MPRALTVQRTLVTPPERKKFAERLKRNREHYAQANCRYWVFEELYTKPGVTYLQKVTRDTAGGDA